MIKFDFNTFVDQLLDKTEYEKLMTKKEEIVNQFNSCDMIGWTENIEEDLIEKIKTTADYVKENFECLVVIGIGGLS